MGEIHAVGHAAAYAVLGVRADASADELRGAYRRLVRAAHPDANPVGGSADALAAVVDAYRAVRGRAPAAPAPAPVARRRHVDVYA